MAITQKMQSTITRKNKITFFKISTRLSTHYPLSAALAIIVLRYQDLQRAITRKNKLTFFLKFSTSDLLIMLYRLTKFEAQSCNSF